MTDLDLLIAFWESVLAFGSGGLSSKQTSLVEETIKALEELKQLKGE